MMTMFEILNRMYKLAIYDRNGRQYLPVRHPYKDEIAVYMRGHKAIEVEINRFVEDDRSIRSIPDYADIMTLSDWMGAIECGAFIPSDGIGYFAKKNENDVLMEYGNTNVWDEFTFNDSFTHIIWYNK